MATSQDRGESLFSGNWIAQGRDMDECYHVEDTRDIITPALLMLFDSIMVQRFFLPGIL